MERHFTLPVVVSAAVHLGLLFGVSSSPTEKIQWTEVPLGFEVADLPPPEPAPAEPLVSADATEPPKPATENLAPVHLPSTPLTTPHVAWSPVATPDFPGIQLPMSPGMPTGDRLGSTRGLALGSQLLDNPPRTRLQMPPQYPYEARRDGRTGQVTVEFMVDESGAVRDPRVVEATDRVFEEAALRAVARWRFEPGRRDGIIVRFRMAVPIVFNLGE